MLIYIGLLLPCFVLLVIWLNKFLLLKRKKKNPNFIDIKESDKNFFDHDRDLKIILFNKIMSNITITIDLFEIECICEKILLDKYVQTRVTFVSLKIIRERYIF